MSRRKKVLRLLGFIVVFMILVQFCDFLFRPYGTTEFLLRNVGKKDQNYDFIIVGASHATYAYDPQTISDNLGVNAFTLAIPNESVNESIDVLKYALETNDVKTVLFDVDWQYFWTGVGESGQLNESKFYAYTPFSMTKISEFFRNASTLDVRGAISGRAAYSLNPSDVLHNVKVKFSDSYKNATIEEVNTTGMPDEYMGRGWFRAPDDSSEPGGQEYVDMMAGHSNETFSSKIFDHMREIKKICDEHGVNLVCFTVPTTDYAMSKWNVENIHTQMADFFDSEGIDWYDGYYMKQSVFPRTTLDYRDLEGHICGSAGTRYTQVVTQILQAKENGTYVESDFFDPMPGGDEQ